MADALKFDIGNQVQHISGGPKMIVKGYGKSQGHRGISHYHMVEDRQKIICEWWDTSNNNFSQREFAASTLKFADSGTITPPKVG